MDIVDQLSSGKRKHHREMLPAARAREVARAQRQPKQKRDTVPLEFGPRNEFGVCVGLAVAMGWCSQPRPMEATKASDINRVRNWGRRPANAA